MLALALLVLVLLYSNFRLLLRLCVRLVFLGLPSARCSHVSLALDLMCLELLQLIQKHLFVHGRLHRLVLLVHSLFLQHLLGLDSLLLRSVLARVL